MVTYAPPTATDNCSAAPVSCVRPSGDTFPFVKTTVVCTAADAANNTDTCSFDVTVRRPLDVAQDGLSQLVAFGAPVTNHHHRTLIYLAIRHLR